MRACGWIGHGVGQRAHHPVVVHPWPFLGIEALASGSIAERAMRRHYEEMYPSVYMPKASKPTALQRAEGAFLWMRRRGVLAGQSAAAVLGTKWIDGDDPAEVLYRNRKAPELLIVRTERLHVDEVTVPRGVVDFGSAWSHAQ